jgi:hypothetical protein
MAALAVGVALSGSPFACSSSAPLGGAGAACILVTDCQDGLVCCNGDKGSLTCVASTSCLQPAGGGGEGGAAATGMGPDAAGGDSMIANQPGSDASQQGVDMGAPPGQPDAGTTKPPVDSGGKPEDTGTPPQEAAPPPTDSGGD